MNAEVQYKRRASDTVKPSVLSVIGKGTVLADEGILKNNILSPDLNNAARPIWDAFNTLYELGACPTKATAIAIAQHMGLSEDAVVVTYVTWRKHYNIQTPF